jgi:hypothetical protein
MESDVYTPSTANVGLVNPPKVMLALEDTTPVPGAQAAICIVRVHGVLLSMFTETFQLEGWHKRDVAGTYCTKELVAPVELAIPMEVPGKAVLCGGSGVTFVPAVTPPPPPPVEEIVTVPSPPSTIVTLLPACKFKRV